MPVESRHGWGKATGPGQSGVLVVVTGQWGHYWSLPGWRRWELLVLLALLSRESNVAGDPAKYGGERRKKPLDLAQRRGEVRKERELVCSFLLHAQPRTLIDRELLHCR